VHAQRWIAAYEHPGGARVIEVDVREDEVAQVTSVKSVRPQTFLECVEARRRPAVDERGLFAGKEVRCDDPRSPQVEEIEKLEAAT
jgi:hypothetical protein